MAVTGNNDYKKVLNNIKTSNIDANKNSIRYNEIDVLRGCACLSVLLYHYTYGFDNGLNQITEERLYFRFGYLGVDLFFTISGYAIYKSISNIEEAWLFIYKRVLRIYPTYWIAIMCTISMTYLFPVPFLPNRYSLNSICVNLSMLQSMYGVDNIDGVYWTLFVEIKFYMLIVVLLILRLKKYIEYICIMWIIICAIDLDFDYYKKDIINNYLIISNAPNFILGILYYKINEKKSRDEQLVYLLIFTTIIFETYKVYKNGNLFAEYIFIVISNLIFLLIALNTLKLPKLEIIRKIGIASYPLYLVHQNIGYIIMYHIQNRLIHNQILCIVAATIISLSISFIIYIKIEKPIMKINKRIEAYIRNIYINLSK